MIIEPSAASTATSKYAESLNRSLQNRTVTSVEPVREGWVSFHLKPVTGEADCLEMEINRNLPQEEHEKITPEMGERPEGL
jgi:hypothetical protein